MPLDIPSDEHYISAVARVGDDLLIRLADDWHSGQEAAAFELHARRVANAQAVIEYLDRARASNEYLYAFERGETVVLSDESGVEMPILADAIESQRHELNRDELSEALAKCRDEYERQYASYRSVSSQIHRLHKLIHEQLRRLEVKAATHEATSAAGVLYAQQTQFLGRLLREPEA